MPIYSPTGFLDITNATLRTSNLEAQNFKLNGGNIYVTSELTTDELLNLDNVVNAGNATSNTVQFTNLTTGLVADSNIVVTGNVTAGSFLGDGSGLTSIPPSAITGTLSQWSDGTNSDVYIASNVGIGNVHTLTSNTLQVGANLYVRDAGANVLTVTGNVAADYFEGDGSKLTGISSTLQAITDSGNVTSNTVQFSNATTGFVTTSNIEVGGALKINTITAAAYHSLQAVTNVGNVTSNTVQFSNATTGLVTTGNVEVGKELTVSGNVAVDTDTLFVDSVNDRVGVGTNSPEKLFEISGASGLDNSSPVHFRITNTQSATSGNPFTDITKPSGLISFYTTDTSTAGPGDVAGIGFRPESTLGGDTALCFYTNSENDDAGTPLQERMCITHDGKVGIGTANPGLFKLNVNGTAHLPSIHRTNFTKELSEYFELVSGTTSTVTLNSLLVEINVTGTASTDMSEYAGTIDLDILGQRTNSTYGVDVIKTQLHFAAAWDEQGDAWDILEFNQENKARNINSYRCITSIPVFRYTYIARKLQIYIQYNALQYRVKHSFTARVSSDEGFAGDIISYAGGAPMTGTDTAAVQGLCYGIGGKLGVGTNSPGTTLELNQGIRPGASSATHGMRWSNTDNTNHWHLFNSDNDHFRFVYNGAAKGYVDPNDANAQMNFTGQHRTFIKDIPFTRAIELEGLIVSADNNKYIKMSGGIEVGSNAITTNESLPVVSLSNVVTDKKCFGVISASEDPENRTEQYGAFGTNFDKEKGDTRVYINSVGEGAIWVTNINGSLESGDYITTSNVAGYGQKQDSDSLKNYTVAKITMDCDFNPVTQPVQIIRKELSNVNYWVKTTYENVTEEEYSTLADENRQIVDDIYQEITKEESKTEQEGYELEVRQELMNVLDEYGQIQWEDHPTETEKAYKIRYLDAGGNITDEVNHVYKAAFVGCTYHCG